MRLIDRAWRMVDPSGTALVLHRVPVDEDAVRGLTRVSPGHLTAQLAGWLSETWTRAVLLDVCAALQLGGGFDGERADHERLFHQVRPALAEAFERGDIVAFEEPVMPAPVFVRPEQPGRPQPPTATRSFFALRVVDEVGVPIAGIAVELRLDGAHHPLHTDGNGIARIDGTPATDGTAFVPDAAALRALVAPRWQKPRTQHLPAGPLVEVQILDDAVEPVGLVRAAVVTLVVAPYFRCFEVPGKSFDFESSFIESTALAGLATIARDLLARPDRRAMIFGHTDRTGSAEGDKQLSERRGEAVLALLTHDHARWAELFRGDRSPRVPEQWGTPETQQMLNAIGCPDGAGHPLDEDGIAGPRTSEAIRRFQSGHYRGKLHEQAPLPATGLVDDTTLRELFLAYARLASRDPIDAGRIAPISGSPFMGCGGFNPFTWNDSDAESRRTVVFVFEVAAEPGNLPCRIGNLGPCREASAPAPKAPAMEGLSQYRCSVYRSIASSCPCQAGEPLRVLRIQLHDERREPVRDLRYRLKVPGRKPRVRKTDGKGTFRCAVSRQPLRLQVAYSPHPGQRHDLAIDVSAAAVGTDAYYLAHLRNFGFSHAGGSDENTILRFQAAHHELDLTGALDRATRGAIDAILGGTLKEGLDPDAGT